MFPIDSYMCVVFETIDWGKSLPIATVATLGSEMRPSAVIVSTIVRGKGLSIAIVRTQWVQKITYRYELLLERYVGVIAGTMGSEKCPSVAIDRKIVRGNGLSKAAYQLDTMGFE